VTSWDAVGSYALQPVALALAGPIAEVVGASTILYAADDIFLLITLAVIAVPSIRNLTGTPEEDLLQLPAP
jgi:hypothetical protein